MSIIGEKTKSNTGATTCEILPFVGAKAPLVNASASWVPFVECILAATKECIEVRAVKPEVGLLTGT